MRKVILKEDGTYSVPVKQEQIEILAEKIGGVIVYEDKVNNEQEKVPVSVERWKARLALREAGILEQIELTMADENTNVVAREAWVGAASFRRDSVTVASIASSFNMSNQEIDELFIKADKIQA